MQKNRLALPSFARLVGCRGVLDMQGRLFLTRKHRDEIGVLFRQRTLALEGVQVLKSLPKAVLV